MVLAWNCLHLFKAIYLTESKGLKSILPSVTIVMLNQSYHQDEYLDSYLISSFEIDDIDIDLADYADDKSRDVDTSMILKMKK